MTSFKDLVARLSIKSGHSIQKTNALARHIIKAMCLQLESGNRIEIRGFGSFAVKRRNCKRRNPQNGEYFLKSGNYITFRMGSVLKNKGKKRG